MLALGGSNMLGTRYVYRLQKGSYPKQSAPTYSQKVYTLISQPLHFFTIRTKFRINVTSKLCTQEQGPLGSNGHFGRGSGTTNKKSLVPTVLYLKEQPAMFKNLMSNQKYQYTNIEQLILTALAIEIYKVSHDLSLCL